MNDRFHALILDACGNRALQRAVALNNKLPFAPASAMLPMQGTVTLDRDWMLYAHRQHHMLFAALKAGEGARVQALAAEHTEVAQMNLRMALERRAETERVLPAIRLVVDVDQGRCQFHRGRCAPRLLRRPGAGAGVTLYPWFSACSPASAA